ncbi:biotin--protein ligase isoform X2 [Linepithema humile]|uniref:biotin--protein ligase isoform X2 n=1 Tax=Linepithema humile TaxID=83485 RepID=UPI00351F461B
MLITLIYMFATYVQSKKISSVKKQLLNSLKEEEYSILFYDVSQHKLVEEKKESIELEQSDDIVGSPTACITVSDWRYAEIKESLWQHADRELYTVYPQQNVTLAQWSIFPLGNVTHPLRSNNLFKISNESERKYHFLVQSERKIYPPASSNFIKLEDYGLIVSFTTDKSYIYFILETDIDHITNFLITVMQGQYYINNGLNLIRVLSVVSSDKSIVPCNIPCLENHLSQECKILDSSKSDDLHEEKNVTCTSTCSSPLKEVDLPLSSKEDGAPLSSKEDGDPLSSKEDDVPSSSKDGPLPSSEENGPSSSKENGPPPSSKEDNRPPSPKNKDSGESSDGKCMSSAEEDTIESEIFDRIPRSSNILVYADCEENMRNVKNLVEHIVSPWRYTVYTLSTNDAHSNNWKDDAALVIAAGNFDAQIIRQLVEYVVRGGKLLALCSNMLHTLIPIFKTAEVYESKLVKFSYDTFKNIDMVHDIFCYQASPVRARFSQGNEEARASELKLPAIIEVKDKQNESHTFSVIELGREETWHNPSLLLATLPTTNGKIVFSQIHLETDPTHYATEETSIAMLKRSDNARFEIVRHLFKNQFKLDITHEPPVKYTPAYFLGLVEKKREMLKNLKSKFIPDYVLKMPKLSVRFCHARAANVPASCTFLPVLMYMCPIGFNTVSYFDNLHTEKIGRLVIFSDVLTSSMDVTGTKLEHGLAVIARQQTKGIGRAGNTWLSPKGCAMFTVQVHIPKDSFLGKRITILQHVVTVAVISAIKSRPEYEDINLRLKWPNDIYAYKKIKIGGTFISTTVEDSLYICNIGVGVNLDNDVPTTCINSLIKFYNKKQKKNTPLIKYEEFFAFVFDELEELIDEIQSKQSLSWFQTLYYEYWLHMNSMVSVLSAPPPCKDVINGTIQGIDDNGFLLVNRLDDKKPTQIHVHPDGNSFDPLKGLILPKQKN